MRAKVVLAATLILTAIQPVFAHNLVREVQRTLYPDNPTVITQQVTAPTATIVSQVITLPAVVSDPLIMEIPAVIAPAVGGVAILTRDPSDLDMRRQCLQRKINDLSAAGALSAGTVTELSQAMQEVNQAEVCMRAKGDLTDIQARRLYKAMDEIATRTDWKSRHSGIGLNSYVGSNPGFWY